jgi:hypothetical protein
MGSADVQFDPVVLTTHVRTVLDESLRECTNYTLDLTGSGHVELVDSDLDTGNLAESVIEKMTALGWKFTHSGDWVVVKGNDNDGA